MTTATADPDNPWDQRLHDRWLSGLRRQASNRGTSHVLRMVAEIETEEGPLSPEKLAAFEEFKQDDPVAEPAPPEAKTTKPKRKKS